MINVNYFEIKTGKILLKSVNLPCLPRLKDIILIRIGGKETTYRVVDIIFDHNNSGEFDKVLVALKSN